MEPLFFKEEKYILDSEKKKNTMNKKIAIIGAGPSGLAFLALRAFQDAHNKGIDVPLKKSKPS